MIKYTDTQVVFREVPDRISLAINISNCPHHCNGCHSAELRKNIGKVLTDEELDRLIKENDGINCVCLMGEGRDIERLTEIVKLIKGKYILETCLYTGSDEFDESIFDGKLDYIKIGHYDKYCGPLDKKTTNQRMYKLIDGKRIDITDIFWK